MAILKDDSRHPSCEVELNILMVNEESVKFRIEFRFGPAFPAINTEIYCLKRDFLQLLEDITQLEPAYLSMLEPHDPGLCIYHIPHYGECFFPGYGIFQIPKEEREEAEQRYKLVFVLDAYEKNHHGARECGPALCIIVTMEQIRVFITTLREQVKKFKSKR